MDDFQAKGFIEVPDTDLKRVQADFAAQSVPNQVCLETIVQTYASSHYLLDPHTACGVAAADSAAGDVTIALATAHPAKFNEAIALSGLEQSFPDEIQALFGLPQRQQLAQATGQDVKRHLVAFFGAASGVVAEDVLETLT